MPTQSAEWIATARLLRRTGFGTTGRAVDAAVAQSDYLTAALGADPEADPGAKTTPLPKFPVLAPPGKSATAAARKAYNGEINDQMRTLSQWWLDRMVAVQQPVHEKLTLLWHNHFATSASKVRGADMMAAQNQKLRAGALGDFRSLAYSMLTDPAMLRWLDGQQNTEKAANENLSREFMELFALGHGNGYTESDVREGARALTGWVIKDGQSNLVRKRHDAGDKTVLGVTGPLDAAGFCDAVLARPESPEYVTQRLWQQLASDNPPSTPAVSRLVGAYGTGRDLKSLTLAILTDPEFVSQPSSLVNTPVEWTVGLVRALGVPTKPNAALLDQTMKMLGQQPFYPPDVGGWPRGQAWLSTASAGVRLHAATVLARKGDVSSVADAAPSDRIDAAGYLLGIGSWSDQSAAALRPLINRPPELVAAAANTPENLTS
ncbi:DUF1800 domain-containing protein [Mycobacterium sp. CBMA293]|uniref:DUF1800 domain-containing protein n=1 Tax=unclassified Mycolicibacterium TaxID=2636767 RepID=UPI0012DEB16D|nr:MULTISPECIES: DUF1800 domain-containing protein [unclassified Mycolicibacterium]MUL49967.1 DUF1800 domain-containing protein [Mycolicibacterium sp. CBMA 360]MUL61586.1 DUF1800 domain-containing protein [Mycolicibacterium sp. CBMA 335]MUL74321.1 DUF1800 domain-containing protein [Mycolicibacterium sp. CBMA 311]MUL96599.1 DUF1800 domain-containing protein [Mycolicibacterium sp. CBMA 230]MUM04243.1 hypothetical protein [Mycolicibacterium sp. CBMA 213]